MLISSYNAPITNTKSAHSMNHENIIKRIKSDAYEKITADLRGINNKEEQNEYKDTYLPFVTWSGVFSERKDSKPDVYSGFIVGEIEDIQDITQLKKKLSDNQFIYFFFTSPSGKGLRVAIKTDNEDPEEHKKYFNAIEGHFYKKHQHLIDPRGDDINRVCHISYDPDVYYNPEAWIWKDKLEEKDPFLPELPKKVLSKDELNRLDPDNLKESLKEYPVEDCGDYFKFECPFCKKDSIYLNKKDFTLTCNDENNCGYEDSLLSRHIEKKVKLLEKNNKNKKLKKEIYSYLTKLDELDREPYLKELSKILDVRLQVLSNDYKKYSKRTVNTSYKAANVEFSVPSGYIMNNKGIFLDGDKKITYNPCCIIAVGENIEDNIEYAKLEYISNGKKKQRIIERSEAVITGKLLELAKYGVPVSSANSMELIKFNEAWYSVNVKNFPHFEVINNIGWYNGCLVLPDRIISANGVNKDVVYHGDIRQDAYKKKGNLKDWVSVIKSLGDLKNGHIIQFLIFAGFASVILEPLGLRPFIIHLHGDSSVGKTTALKLVCTIFGRPEEGYALIRWKNTHNFIIRYIENLKNLPLIIDELSTENRQSHDDLLYMFESKIGKGKASRSNPNSIVKQKSFNTGMFSSGERPILGDHSLTGAQVRTWEFSDLPFGETNINDLIVKIEEMRMLHYGVALEPFIDRFSKNKDAIANAKKTFYKGDPLNDIEKRLLKALNPIYINALLVNKLFDFEWDVEAIFNKIFDLIREPFSEKNKTVDEIFSEIRGEYEENRNNFFEIGVNDNGKQYVKEKDYRGKTTYGYKYNNDLWWLKTSFTKMWNSKKGRGTGGKYVIERLLEKGCIESKRSRKSVEGNRVEVIVFPNFFEEEDENDNNDLV